MRCKYPDILFLTEFIISITIIIIRLLAEHRYRIIAHIYNEQCMGFSSLNSYMMYKRLTTVAGTFDLMEELIRCRSITTKFLSP